MIQLNWLAHMAMENKPLHSLLISSSFQAPALLLLMTCDVVSEINPFLPTLLSVMVFLHSSSNAKPDAYEDTLRPDGL